MTWLVFMLTAWIVVISAVIWSVTKLLIAESSNKSKR